MIRVLKSLLTYRLCFSFISILETMSFSSAILPFESASIKEHYEPNDNEWNNPHASIHIPAPIIIEHQFI